MKSNPFFRFATNNHRFKVGEADYGRAYFINVILLVLLLMCASFLIPNILMPVSKHILLINILGLVVATIGIVYFHKTGQVNKISSFFVVSLFILFIYYSIIADPNHYYLYWLFIFPPIIFFLLGHEKAMKVSYFYVVILMVVIAIKFKIWEMNVYNIQSYLNIIVSSVVLILLINFYERSRSEVSEELELRDKEFIDIISDLSDSKEKFEILLASTEEGIYGINLLGECIFCNKSGLKFLGYNVETELLGKNMHEQIHNKHKDGSHMSVHDCKIFKVFENGKGVRVSDEVFWKKDGTAFDVEYAAYPQHKGEDIIGVVITFRDITQEKAALKRLQYLNSHDWLTGLNNRSFFEEKIKELDKAENLPISIIFSDINRLKLTNDIFGHSAGDRLLIKASEVLNTYKRKNDVLARVGGDEFVLVLPKTDLQEALNREKEIQNHFATYSVNSIPCSMAIGSASKTDENQEINHIITNAEGEMYKEKTIDRQSSHEDMVYTLIGLLHTKSPREKTHSENVMMYSQMIGTAVKLSLTELAQLKRMAYFHDIGKLVLDDELLQNEGKYSTEEFSKIKQHPAFGYRILNLFDGTLDIANGVYAHHESWDGSGYPKGLKGEEIPYMSRIISIAEVYDALTNKINGEGMKKDEALKIIKEMSGSKLDPHLASVFIDLMNKE